MHAYMSAAGPLAFSGIAAQRHGRSAAWPLINLCVPKSFQLLAASVPPACRTSNMASQKAPDADEDDFQSSANDGETCTICFDDLVGDSLFRFQCPQMPSGMGHAVDLTCMSKMYFRENDGNGAPSCPVCRAPFAGMRDHAKMEALCNKFSIKRATVLRNIANERRENDRHSEMSSDPYVLPLPEAPWWMLVVCCARGEVRRGRFVRVDSDRACDWAPERSQSDGSIAAVYVCVTCGRDLRANDSLLDRRGPIVSAESVCPVHGGRYLLVDIKNRVRVWACVQPKPRNAPFEMQGEMLPCKVILIDFNNYGTIELEHSLLGPNRMWPCNHATGVRVHVNATYFIPPELHTDGTNTWRTDGTDTWRRGRGPILVPRSAASSSNGSHPRAVPKPKAAAALRRSRPITVGDVDAVAPQSEPPTTAPRTQEDQARVILTDLARIVERLEESAANAHGDGRRRLAADAAELRERRRRAADAAELRMVGALRMLAAPSDNGPPDRRLVVATAAPLAEPVAEPNAERAAARSRSRSPAVSLASTLPPHADYSSAFRSVTRQGSELTDVDDAADAEIVRGI